MRECLYGCSCTSVSSEFPMFSPTPPCPHSPQILCFIPPNPIDFGSNKPSFMSASMINDRVAWSRQKWHEEMWLSWWCRAGGMTPGASGPNEIDFQPNWSNNGRRRGDGLVSVEKSELNLTCNGRVATPDYGKNPRANGNRIKNDLWTPGLVCRVFWPDHAERNLCVWDVTLLRGVETRSIEIGSTLHQSQKFNKPKSSSNNF